MKKRILSELARIEKEDRVRVLLAVESGSRAWGFASPDSDYDVRFIYAHERDWYLSVFDERDVIEEMLPDKLDVSGWDLRKTLRLFGRCNLALNEWFGSPIIYSKARGFHPRMVKLIPRYFNPIGAMHHYRSMADRAIAENLADGRIPIKKLFYVLRPLYACRWIEQTGGQPPTEFQRLVETAWVSRSEKRWVARLLKEKSRAAEAESIELEAERSDLIRSELDRYKNAVDLVEGPEGHRASELNNVFREWILDP